MSTGFQDLRDFMDEVIPRIGTSGIDCIVYKNHEEIFRHAAGYSNIEEKLPMQKDALYNLYSGSKIVVCVAAMQLVEKGKIGLADPVAKYLPAYEKLRVKTSAGGTRPAQKPMLIAHLFTMTAGIISYDLSVSAIRDFFAEKKRDFDTIDFAEALAKQPLLFEPGEDWLYGFSHDVLGAVIEVVSGMKLGEYLRRNIFQPLGMVDTAFELTDKNRHRIAPQYDYDLETGAVTRIASECFGKFGNRQESAGAGLISSCEEYILFADALACGGVGKNGARVISENSLRLMRQNQLNEKCLASFHGMIPAEGNGYGLGVSVISNPAASFSLAPAGSFAWGGMGGVQNFFDMENRLSLFVAQHIRNSPKHLIEPYLKNIVYAIIGSQ